MAEYIDKTQAIIEMMDNDVDHAQGIDGREVVQILEDIPAADVVPVIHGRWIPYRCDMYECSVCQRIHTSFDSGECDADYCPHCGAKMDGEE